jgi:positive regulator of sigma E activity
MDRLNIAIPEDCHDFNQPFQSLIKDRVRIIDVQSGFVTVRIPVYSACAGCHSKCLMAGEMQERTLRLPMPLDLPCKPGDEVDLHINPRFVTQASFLIYFLPAVLLMLFAYAGRIAAPLLGWQDPDKSSLLAIVLAIPWVIFLIRWSRKKMGGVENIRIISRSH